MKGINCKRYKYCINSYIKREFSFIANAILLSFIMFIVVVSTSTIVFALPQNGQVVSGSATISSPNTTTVQINQSSDKAIVDWSTYNINANETARYVQPQASSIILNRINENNGASNILGTITANGHVWLINPAGIMFGPNAHIDVAGLLASTASISQADFNAGRYVFRQSPNFNAAIVNEGTITIKDTGLAAFLAPAVINSGVIQANLGTVVLASGTQFTVDLLGDQLINLVVNEKLINASVTSTPIDPRTNKPVTDLVSNSGTIIANGGLVLLSASGVENIVNNVVNMSGVIQAKTVVKRKGIVTLLGGDAGIVNVSGTIDASGTQPGQTGGTVQILGEKVIIASNANINVSGNSAGGVILIGENFKVNNDVTSVSISNGSIDIGAIQDQFRIRIDSIFQELNSSNSIMSYNPTSYNFVSYLQTAYGRSFSQSKILLDIQELEQTFDPHFIKIVNMNKNSFSKDILDRERELSHQ